jgi:hypothetical protein
MKSTKVFVVLALLISAIVLVNVTVVASNAAQKDFTIGKKGVIHFNVPVKAGNRVLQPGMYQLQHVIEGGDHLIAFKAVEMPAGYRHNNNPVSDEVSAGIKCRVEAAEKVNKTKITLRTNAAGEKEIAEVQVAGEAFKHIL